MLYGCILVQTWAKKRSKRLSIRCFIIFYLHVSLFFRYWSRLTGILAFRTLKRAANMGNFATRNRTECKVKRKQEQAKLENKQTKHTRKKYSSNFLDHLKRERTLAVFPMKKSWYSHSCVSLCGHDEKQPASKCQQPETGKNSKRIVWLCDVICSV